MTLLDVIRDHIGVQLSSFGEAAVNAYGSQFGPPARIEALRLQPIDAHRIVEAGWPLAVLGSNRGLERILGKRMEGRVAATDWSVIHAGALLTKLGARVEFPEEEITRTPDLQAFWGARVVDAEVKTAMPKERQTEMADIMEALREAIGLRGRSWHLLIHLGAAPVGPVQLQIIDAVLALEPGQRAGFPNIWDVYAVPLEDESALAEGRLDRLRPEWWKDDGPSLRNIGVLMSANPEDARRICIIAKLSLSYINQIREKAERPQGNPNHPFLIMVDQGSGTAMPMRHQKIQADLAPWLPLWPHVSGILCFDRRPYVFNRFCWKLSFHPNPDAVRPLPEVLLAMTPHDPEICVTPFAE